MENKITGYLRPVAAVCALVCAISAAVLFSGCSDPLKGRTAPAFQLEDRAGKAFSLADYRGKTVMLYFWATWAPPSRLGMAQMVRVQADYRKRNLAVLAVAVRDDKKQVGTFLKGTPVNFPVLLGTTGTEQSYFGSDGLKLPVVLLLDDRGVVRERFTGYQDREDLVPAIDKVVEPAR